MRALALLLLLALPAAAQEARLPALFDVAGVASDDALNVRRTPRTTANPIGELRHDATDIEVITLSESGDWGLVTLGEQSGWAAMRFLARQPGQGWDVPPAIRTCVGTEPFWGLDLRAGSPGFSTPLESLPIDVPAITPVDGRVEPWVLNAEGDHAPLLGILSRRACSDGMSDRAFGYRLDLIQGGRGLTGCCTLAP